MKSPTNSTRWLGGAATAVFLAFAGIPTTHAAVVTWGAAQQISNDSNVSTAGTLVGAVNLGDSSSSLATTVNGVAFQGLAVNIGSTSGSVANFTVQTADPLGFTQFPNGTFGSASAPFAGLSASYRTLLNSALTISNPSTFTLTMSGLTVGQAYQFEWFANTSGPGNELHIATAGNSSTLNDNTSGQEGGLGQFAVGSFVADSTSQVITFSAGAGNFAQLNAFQLRAIPVPESASLLFGLGIIPVIVAVELRRKRRNSGTVPA